MNDTSQHVAQLVAERHAAITPTERLQIASSMYETARQLIAASLPPGLTREQRRYAIIKRMYGNELPEDALQAHANFPEEP
jgi:hypothetical protein